MNKYDETPGRELIKAFHGFNTMHQTGRTVASKKRAATLRAATPAETVEHGRWCLNRSSLDMPMAYLRNGRLQIVSASPSFTSNEASRGHDVNGVRRIR